MNRMTFTTPSAKIHSETGSPVTREQFTEILTKNPGHVIVKFGAEWCGPCKRIESHVHQWFAKMPTDKVKIVVIDVDESFDLYGAFKSKRQVNGIPAILRFDVGNISYIPNDAVVGADFNQINDFFASI